MIESNVDRCLRCNYPLVGLPTAHVCPECGLSYDTETIVFRPTGESRRGLLERLETGMRVATLLVVGVMFAVGWLRSASDLYLMAIIVGSMVVTDTMLRRRRRERRFVALAPSGLVAGLGAGRVSTMAYEDIWDIADDGPVVRMDPKLELEGVEAQTRAIPIGGVFDSESEYREFRRRLEARTGRLLTQGATPAPAPEQRA
mgnify:CR=1 FL=1